MILRGFVIRKWELSRCLDTDHFKRKFCQWTSKKLKFPNHCVRNISTPLNKSVAGSNLGNCNFLVHFQSYQKSFIKTEQIFFKRVKKLNSLVKRQHLETLKWQIWLGFGQHCQQTWSFIKEKKNLKRGFHWHCTAACQQFFFVKSAFCLKRVSRFFSRKTLWRLFNDLAPFFNGTLCYNYLESRKRLMVDS